MKGKVDLVRGWLLKAESDLIATRRILEGEGPYDTACYHCQQAIEKVLKAFLLYHDQKIVHTHDLEELAGACSLLDETLEWEDFDLEQITDYAVAARYDYEFWPDDEVAREALAKAEEIKERMTDRLPPEMQKKEAKEEPAGPEEPPSPD